MLFKKDWVGTVLEGRKTQSVRLKQPRMTVGRTYAVQTSFRSTSVGRIRVTGIRPCSLADLADADIVAEGWPASQRDEFERYFAQTNHFDPDAMDAEVWRALRERRIWCIDFEPAPNSEPGTKHTR